MVSMGQNVLNEGDGWDGGWWRRLSQWKKIEDFG